MKIFNIENGKKKVYVQLNDVMMIMHFAGVVPVEVMSVCFDDVFIVTNENRFEFVEFNDPHTIEFFEQCDWIPDFREFKDLTEAEIIAKGQEVVQEIKEIATRWNEMTPEEKEENEELYTRYESLDYKSSSIEEFLLIKYGYRVMPFPMVPDYEGFRVNNDDCEYMAQQGLNPLQVLFFRKDGQTMNENIDIVPCGLVQAAESILVNNNLEHNEFFGDFEIIRVLSDDKKYIVTTFKILPKKEDVKEVKETQPSKEKMTLGKRIKKWFNRKRSN